MLRFAQRPDPVFQAILHDALAPIRGAMPAIPRNRPEVRQALRTANAIVTSWRESPVLRRAALAVLRRLGDESVVDDLRLVLYEEWHVLGEQILPALPEIGGGTAADPLRDFALAPLGGTELWLGAIAGLQALGGTRSVAALERIAQEVTNTKRAAAAERVLIALEERTGGGSLCRNTGDLRLPGSVREPGQPANWASGRGPHSALKGGPASGMDTSTRRANRRVSPGRTAPTPTTRRVTTAPCSSRISTTTVYSQPSPAPGCRRSPSTLSGQTAGR